MDFVLFVKFVIEINRKTESGPLTPIFMLETILSIILCVSSTICLWSAFLLAYDWQGNRQRLWLSLVLFLWGMAWSVRAYGLIFDDTERMYGLIMPPELILVGIVAGFTFLVWPLTVLSAPKLKARQILLFCLPLLLCIVTYYGVIGIFSLQRFDFLTFEELWAHISYFSVWFRFVMCFCLLGYLLYTIRLIKQYIGQYNRYVEENFSEYNKYTIKWMPAYLFGLIAITILFFTYLCFASYTTFMCHNLVSCIFLAWLTTKVLVYNSPYTTDNTVSVIPELSKTTGEDFNSKFEIYRQQIEMWLVDERPYLRTDFNLKDVMTRFKLNRTYASKIFNDGFGKSFIFVVRELRIDYAKKIIENNPTASMAEVADLCGYSTAQAFHKAFVFCNNGLTPGKYALSVSQKE